MYLVKSTLNLENARNIHISSKLSQSRMQNSACSHTRANTSNGIKIQFFFFFFFEKVGKMLSLSSAPLRHVFGKKSVTK